MNHTVKCLRVVKMTSGSLRSQASSVRDKSSDVQAKLDEIPTSVTFNDGLLHFHHGSNKYVVSYWTPLNQLAQIMENSNEITKDAANELQSINSTSINVPVNVVNVNGEDVTAKVSKSMALGQLLSENMKINLNVTSPATLSMASESIGRCISWAQVNKQAAQSQSLLEVERQNLLSQYEPMVNQFMTLVQKAEVTASSKFKWGGLFLLSGQLGFFARLIWVDYSWDVMEPITWCVTYSMMVATFAYYIIYSQEFMLPLAEKRAVQMKLWKLVQAQQGSGQFDLRSFRRLRRKLVAIEASKSPSQSTAFDTLLKSGITG